MQRRYAGLDFRPPVSVRKAAALGLVLRKRFGRGGLTSRIAGKLGIGSGIVRATTLATGKHVSPRTVRRMKAYFSRHASDKRPGWSKPSAPSNGYIAWLLWGGDAGRSWANNLVRQMDAREKTS